MVNLDVGELRSKIDINGLYVDFGILRSALNISTVAKDSGISLSEPTYEGESRGKCPKCGKQRSLSLNINTNRFYCFTKNCAFKGGGAIDFFARLNDTSAKDASHLLACAYGIQPYNSGSVPEPNGKPKKEEAVENTEEPKEGKDVVSREEFDELKARFERFTSIVWVYMLENDPPGRESADYDPPLTRNHVMG